MVLKVIIDDQLYELNVPDAFMQEAGEFFDQMDRDMDKGWQMSREWAEHPSLEDRCRIVGNKLLTALEKENHKLGRLMAGYILSRLPQIESLDLDTAGEMQNTQINLKSGAGIEETAPRPAVSMDRPEILEQAEKDVTQVFKVGRHWRFSVHDHKAGEWVDSPAVASEEEANALRQRALRLRYDELNQH